MQSIADPYAGTFHDSFMQLHILEHGTRADVIEWLCWNDPDGCYTDADNDLEQLPHLTLEQARDIMRGQID